MNLGYAILDKINWQIVERLIQLNDIFRIAWGNCLAHNWPTLCHIQLTDWTTQYIGEISN